ncbi:multidrug MFS transporter [Actinoplanes sp. SE50]|uniref:DHA2 family efflux MFS transporter permease subunit n=1 Tax=unclassified Actinoplanes TaxID=2626549 RepID=UPI00023ECCD3|nr:MULTISPECIES: DHA2 family efflux MFS transporter permease subunit [unclassified Actinoplanes]AEV84843.1 EmrB/QacA family drug resistance transporter [Actinoplanes sp. SE50/110]ATO83234.1 multidrug MFS transporter [Actinoplanes sp. SE50]SLM00641.1 multidrug MFS transporter [Actinoplanes sp. SE50/110]
MTAEISPRRRWLGLLVVSFGVAMIIVDATIVNVAVPSIIDDLGATSSDAQWVQESYTVVLAALLLVAGRTADRVGRRRLFMTGIGVFMLGSIGCALAPAPPLLIVARQVQGVGGAMILPTSLSLLNAGFTGRERGIAFAVWGSTIGGAAALGPLLGGWLTTAVSWRWAFGINLPLSVLILIAAPMLLAESRESGDRRGNDRAGAVLSSLSLGCLVFALIEGRSFGWFERTGPVSVAGVSWTLRLSPVPIAFGLAAAGLVTFLWLEHRRNAAGRPVLLDLRLFAIPSFRNGNLVAAVVSLGEFGLLFALPLWLQNVRGYSAFQTGLALLPLAAGSFVASGLAIPLAAKRGAIFLVRLGIVLEIAGVAGIGLVAAPDTAWWQVTPLLFGYGVGVGLATAQITGVVLADVPVAMSGQASGTQSTTRQLGSALGIAVLGTILFSTLAGHLSSALDDRGVPAQQRSAVVAAVKDSAGAAIPGLAGDPRTAPLAADAKQALSTATRWTAFTAAGFLLIGLLASARLTRTTPGGDR